MPLEVVLEDRDISGRKAIVGTDGALRVNMIGSMVPYTYDSVTLAYTGSDLTTAVFKQGATTVATLTMTYDGSHNMLTVTRT